MRFACNDIVVFKTPDNVFRSKISSIDGNVVKLFEKDGSYRQISRINLEQMVEQGLAHIERPDINYK